MAVLPHCFSPALFSEEEVLFVCLFYLGVKKEREDAVAVAEAESGGGGGAEEVANVRYMCNSFDGIAFCSRTRVSFF